MLIFLSIGAVTVLLGSDGAVAFWLPRPDARARMTTTAFRRTHQDDKSSLQAFGNFWGSDNTDQYYRFASEGSGGNELQQGTNVFAGSPQGPPSQILPGPANVLSEAANCYKSTLGESVNVPLVCGNPPEPSETANYLGSLSGSADSLSQSAETAKTLSDAVTTMSGSAAAALSEAADSLDSAAKSLSNTVNSLADSAAGAVGTIADSAAKSLSGTVNGPTDSATANTMGGAAAMPPSEPQNILAADPTTPNSALDSVAKSSSDTSNVISSPEKMPLPPAPNSAFDPAVQSLLDRAEDRADVSSPNPYTAFDPSLQSLLDNADVYSPTPRATFDPAVQSVLDNANAFSQTPSTAFDPAVQSLLDTADAFSQTPNIAFDPAVQSVLDNAAGALSAPAAQSMPESQEVAPSFLSHLHDKAPEVISSLKERGSPVVESVREISEAAIAEVRARIASPNPFHFDMLALPPFPSETFAQVGRDIVHVFQMGGNFNDLIHALNVPELGLWYALPLGGILIISAISKGIEAFRGTPGREAREDTVKSLTDEVKYLRDQANKYKKEYYKLVGEMDSLEEKLDQHVEVEKELKAELSEMKRQSKLRGLDTVQKQLDRRNELGKELREGLEEKKRQQIVTNNEPSESFAQAAREQKADLTERPKSTFASKPNPEKDFGAEKGQFGSTESEQSKSPAGTESQPKADWTRAAKQFFGPKRDQEVELEGEASKSEFTRNEAGVASAEVERESNGDLNLTGKQPINFLSRQKSGAPKTEEELGAQPSDTKMQSRLRGLDITQKQIDRRNELEKELRDGLEERKRQEKFTNNEPSESFAQVAREPNTDLAETAKPSFAFKPNPEQDYGVGRRRFGSTENDRSGSSVGTESRPGASWTEAAKQFFGPKRDQKEEFGGDTSQSEFTRNEAGVAVAEVERESKGDRTLTTKQPMNFKSDPEQESAEFMRYEPRETFVAAGREPTSDWLSERTNRLFNSKRDLEEEFGTETGKQLINFKSDPEQEFGAETKQVEFTRDDPIDTFATAGTESTSDGLSERTKRLFNSKRDPEEEFGDETGRQLINFKRDPDPKQLTTFQNFEEDMMGAEMRESPQRNSRQRAMDGMFEPLAASYLLNKSDPTRLTWKEVQDTWGTWTEFMAAYDLKPSSDDDLKKALDISRRLKQGRTSQDLGL